MKRLSMLALTLLAIGTMGLSLPGCMRMYEAGVRWTTLIDSGDGLENWNRVGDANWHVEGDAIVADKGKGGFLVSKRPYRDFIIRAEFWADHNTNSGIFIRLSNSASINAKNSYEVQIFDQRPDPTYSTGAIVNFARLEREVKAGEQWNLMEITAQGPYLRVVLNGVQTVSIRDGQFAQGPFALQFANGPKDAPGGAIKWRKVQVRELAF